MFPLYAWFFSVLLRETGFEGMYWNLIPHDRVLWRIYIIMGFDI